MATKSFHLKNALAGTSGMMSLQDGGSAPGVSTIATGWTVGTTAAGNHSRMDAQTVRAAATFGATAQPDGAPDNTLGDCWRSENAYSGEFDAGNWQFNFKFRSDGNDLGQDGRIRMRVWASVNQNGSSARELTAGAQVGSIVTNLTSSATQTSAITWAAPAILLAGEYIFVQVAWEITGAAGGAAAAIRTRIGEGAEITTTDFELATLIGAAAVAQSAATAALTTDIRLAASAAATAAASAAISVRTQFAAVLSAGATAAGTLGDYIVPSPVVHVAREFEAYLRGPVGAITHAFGTEEGFRNGLWHAKCMLAAPDIQESSTDDSGIQSGGGFTAQIADPPVSDSGYAAHIALVNDWRQQVCELERVTRYRFADGTQSEVITTRRATAKRIIKKRGVIEITFADIDRDRFTAVFPPELFTVEDFPELYEGHHGRRITQGVGTVLKVPLTWVKSTGGTWRYAGPQVLPAGAGTLLAVYRGERPGEGRVVPSSEYTQSTMAGAVSGIQVHTVDFSREQINLGGDPYLIEADWLLPGDRAFSAEVKRRLELAGAVCDTASFADAIAYDHAAGFLCDPLYGASGSGDGGRNGNVDMEYLLAGARATLVPGDAGVWRIVQDRPRIATLQMDTQGDDIDIDEFGDAPDIPATVTLQYRPKGGGRTGYAFPPLQRACQGAAGAKNMENPFIYDGAVADRLLCYWQKRLNNYRVAVGRMAGLDVAPGAVIQITDGVSFTGVKRFGVQELARVPDGVSFTLREYVADNYIYTPATLPAGASNVYGPDYSFTPPAAPTGLTQIGSGGTIIATDRTVSAWAKFRVTPPALNWAELRIVVRDVSTGEQIQAQFLLESGNYDVTVAGLKPNRSYTAEAWAVNGSGLAGFFTASLPFTSAENAGAPSAPGGVAVAQHGPRQVRVSWNASANAIGYIVAVSLNGTSGWVSLPQVAALSLVYDVGSFSTFYFRVRAVAAPNVEGSDSGNVSITISPLVDDAWIPSQGVSGVSIANASINRSRGSTSTGSIGGALGAFSNQNYQLESYSFFPGIRATNGFSEIAHLTTSSVGSGDTGVFGLAGSANSLNLDIEWRNFLT